jgi:uncharacterized membrane protein
MSDKKCSWCGEKPALTDSEWCAECKEEREFSFEHEVDLGYGGNNVGIVRINTLAEDSSELVVHLEADYIVGTPDGARAYAAAIVKVADEIDRRREGTS